MESAFASASAIGDQRQKIEEYKHILSSVIASNDISFGRCSVVVSRQLLQTFAQELGRLEPENQKNRSLHASSDSPR
ncbi:hypothetical protein R6Q59_025252 [Mikania micrantha]